jgi:hypothetical protein
VTNIKHFTQHNAGISVWYKNIKKNTVDLFDYADFVDYLYLSEPEFFELKNLQNAWQIR